jgi:4-hydroxythreonine-4-phosphate dehydrogenase
LTLGEPAGIGPDLALAIWRRRAELDIAPFYMVADPDFLRRRAQRLGLDVPLVTVTPATAAGSFRAALPVVPLGIEVSAEPGHPDRSSAPAAIASIRRAVADVLAGAASAVITNPIAKNVLYNWGFAEPGHTEFLAKLVQEATGKVLRPVMMLWAPELAVVPVTIHLPLKEIFEHLSAALIVETGRIVARDLSQRFGLRHPRLVIAGLNPHAGEAGSLGREEIEIIEPAVAELRAAGIEARGPLPPDTMFHAEARGAYDAALCMYHDQALIPIKTIDFHGGVNVTLGLPFVRTSPDHGTALAIAGRGTARPDSLIAALRLAAEMAARRSASG